MYGVERGKIRENYLSLFGEIPEFPSKLSTMRKYNISATVILQDISQIEARYEKEWKTIVGNCSSIVFLGSQEPNTLKYFSDMLGKRTVKNKGRGTSNGKSKGSNESYQNTGRELRTPDELGRMSAKKCIVFTQNMRPIEDYKFKYENHPRYQMTADYDNSKGFQYKEMAIYDNSRFSIDHILKAKSESARIAKEREVTDPQNVKGKFVSGSKDDILNRCYFDPSKEESSYLERTTKCRKELALKAHHAVAYVDVGAVPSRCLISLAKQQKECGHPFILFANLNEKDHTISAIGYDVDGALYPAMKHGMVKTYEIIESFCFVRLNKNRVKEYQDAVTKKMTTSTLPKQKNKTKENSKEVFGEPELENSELEMMESMAFEHDQPLENEEYPEFF